MLNHDDFRAALVEIKQSQPLLARPTLGPVAGGDAPPNSVVESGTDGAAAEDNSTIEVWVHDRYTEPGKTYRYRLRVRLWNRFIGRGQALRDAADAARVTIPGAWSQPSDPIMATPRSYVFLLGQGVGDAEASVEVWKWHLGRWLRKSFTAAVGDVIGGVRAVRTDELDASGRPVRERVDFDTGVLVLEIREETRPVRVSNAGTGGFEWVERPTLVMVCRNPVDGRVLERSQAEDRVDPVRARLRQLNAKPTKTPRKQDRDVRPRPTEDQSRHKP